MSNRLTAAFDNYGQAELAIAGLRHIGVRDSQLSVLTRHQGETTAVGSGAAIAATDEVENRVKKGVLAGAGVGALFGLAALAIPGVGPFVTAGWLAHALGVSGSALASGAIVGGTSGAVAGAFSRAGYDDQEAQYYGNAVEQGGIVVAVDTKGFAAASKVRHILSEYGGHFATVAAA